MTIVKTINEITSALKILILCSWLCIIVSQVTLAKQGVCYPDSVLSSEKTKVITPDTLQKAVLLGDINLVKKLIKDGVNPNIKDERGWTPLDYAKKRNRSEIKTVLLANGARTFPKTIPDMVEGPHIRLLDSLIVEVSFLNHDSKSDKSTLVSESYHISKFPKIINGTPVEPGDLDFISKSSPPASFYSGTKKIFIVGDVHGEYKRVLDLLKENSVVDKDSNWSWGKGHLVFIGDIFDRGSKVTEMLWLIFDLEKQAEQSGGKVHLLLGNHELMILNGDIRYITNEYYSLYENLGLNYSSLFDERSLLGYWIRQKPVMLNINNFVFLHAGISPEFCEMELKPDSINRIVWQYLNDTENEKNVETRQFILGSKGILWYRGLVTDGSQKEIINEITLNRALEFYGARAFIIGHTEVDSISSFYGEKVIDVNIPKGRNDIKEQGLLIRGKKLWVVYDSGKKKKF